MDAKRQDGQALLLALGGAFALIAAALALVAIAGAITGKGRVQRAADLAAISAARSMRDDLPRLLSPSRLPNGSPNPRHIEKATYLARAREAAIAAAKANGVSAARLRVAFPDADSFAPVRAEAVVTAAIEVGGGARARKHRRWPKRARHRAPPLNRPPRWRAEAATAAHSSIARATG